LFNWIAPSGPNKVRLPYPEPPGDGATISLAVYMANAPIPAPIIPATIAIPIGPNPPAILKALPTISAPASCFATIAFLFSRIIPAAVIRLDAKIIPFIIV